MLGKPLKLFKLLNNNKNDCLGVGMILIFGWLLCEGERERELKLVHSVASNEFWLSIDSGRRLSNQLANV